MTCDDTARPQPARRGEGRRRKVRSLLRSIGMRHGMENKTSDSKESGTLVLISEGELSYTQFGARRYKDTIPVDLLFKSLLSEGSFMD
jgi:hypothetical protein